MSQKRVLIVDDSRTARVMLRRMVQAALPDAEIQEGADGADGIELFRDWRPDIAFLDQNMPMLTGLDVLREIRKMDPDAFAVMVTADRTRDRIEEAKELNVSGYIGKPYSQDDVSRVIKRANQTYI